MDALPALTVRHGGAQAEFDKAAVFPYAYRHTYDCDDLKDAEPDTLRYRLWALPARLVRYARARVLKISRTWPWKVAFLACWRWLCALPAPA